MALENVEKLTICKKYDSFLSKCASLEDYIHTGAFCSVLNNRRNVGRGDFVPEEHAFSIISTISKTIPDFDLWEGMQYALNPDFELEMLVKQYPNRSDWNLEDFFLVRKEMDQYVIEENLKGDFVGHGVETDYNSLTKIHAVELGIGLYSFSTSRIYVPKTVFDADFARLIMAEFGQSRQFRHSYLLPLFWKKLEEAGWPTDTIIENKVCLSMQQMHDNFMEVHVKDFKDDDWTNVQPIIFDNRIKDSRGQVLTLEKQFRSQMK